MFTPNQTSASRRPLLSMLVHTALSATDRSPEVFSSPTNRATTPPLAYAAQIVRRNPIEMNTCAKNRGGGGRLFEIWFKAFDLPSLWESYSCTKTMHNSHEIILFHKNRGWGAA